jgi:hypothetical protein
MLVGNVGMSSIMVGVDQPQQQFPKLAHLRAYLLARNTALSNAIQIKSIIVDIIRILDKPAGTLLKIARQKVKNAT